MRNFLLLAVWLLLWPLSICAQTADAALEGWLQEYIEARNAGKDSAMPLVRINDYYKESSTAVQASCRDALKAKIASELRAGNKETVLCLIELYDFIVTAPTDRAPELYFIEGNIYAERNDSVALKGAMRKIEALGRGEQLHDKLAVYLEKMRNYIPADKYLEGYWVSDVRSGFTHHDVTYYWAPFCRFKVKREDDKTHLVLLNSAPVSDYALVDDLEPLTSRMVIPYSVDSVYICWSSERLRNVNLEEVSSYRNIVREASAQAAGITSQRHRYSSSEQLANGLLVNIAEMGINSLISSLSTPNKTVTLTQARLKRINDRLYRGTLHYYQCRVSASGTRKEETWTLPVNFHRWDEESNVLFCWGGGFGFPMVGHNPEEVRVIKQDKSGYYVQWYQTLKGERAIGRAQRAEAFNTQQFRQLEIYNQRLLDPAQTPIIEVPEGMQMVGWLGLDGQKATPELVAEHKLTTDAGVVVDSLYAASPALVAGLRKGDLVQRINGKEISSIETINQLITTFEAGAEITIEGERAGKPIKRLVRLSYQFVPQKE